MIEITDKYKCCGCSACSQICPVKCITMKEDSEGFAYPVADKNRCTGCRLCEKICPCLNKRPQRKPLQINAVINNREDIRLESSSGGMFTILAEKILANGGRVFGAAFDSHWNVCHTCISSPEELGRLRGSKYVQSNTLNTFAEAKAYLDKGIQVLYSGTPCQIAALRSFLRKDYSNLWLADFICHGVPSPMVWRKYLEETVQRLSPGKGTEAIDYITFRDKVNGWRLYSMTIRCGENAMTEKVTENAWLKGFLGNLYLRPSCFRCMLRHFNSGSDITLSDFWNIKRFAPEMDDNKGASLAYIHTPKGQELFDITGCRIKQLHTFKYPDMVYTSTSFTHKRKTFYRKLADGNTMYSAVAELSQTSGFEKRMKKLKRKIRNIIHAHENHYTDQSVNM